MAKTFSFILISQIRYPHVRIPPKTLLYQVKFSDSYAKTNNYRGDDTASISFSFGTLNAVMPWTVIPRLSFVPTYYIILCHHAE